MMLVYKSQDSSGSLDIETVAYLTNESEISIYQYQFRGTDVVSSSCVTLNPAQCVEIIAIASRAQLQKFVENYKVDDNNV